MKTTKNNLRNASDKRQGVYGHRQLAQLYFPNVQPTSASNQLALWIRRDPELLAELTRAGYVKGQRMYSPLQLRILLDHLGDPETNPYLPTI